MKQELAQDIALMRYSMISPLIVGLPDEYRSKEAYAPPERTPALRLPFPAKPIYPHPKGGEPP